MNNITHAHSALSHLDASCSREQWIKIAIAAKASGLSFDDFHEWSKNGRNYKNSKDCKSVWDSIEESGEISGGTLFYLAKLNGWRGTSLQPKNELVNSRTQLTDGKKIFPLEVWERCLPAAPSHKYITRKQGVANGLRFYPETEQELTINGINVAGYLVVPCWSENEIQTLQFISSDGSKKLNLPGASFNYGYFVLGQITGIVYICEGIGHAWAMQKVDATAIVCFSAGRMMRISKVIREKYPNIRIIIVSDRGKEKQARDISTIIDGEWIKLPQDKPENYDVNDYLLEHGDDALRRLINHTVEMPLDVIFADELSEDFQPPDELIEGILTIGDSSVLYGDANAGKTFFVIDIACAIACGKAWLGRKTEPGLVVYLAVESPASVQRRLQAYQKHNNVRITNLAIVKNPINLFNGEADTKKIIQLIKYIEQLFGQKVRLIIGDTLARLSVGANENAGQDMGQVIHNVDHIRTECNAHFMLIHHNGKNAAAGARGWSGVRAAVDTEIEITDSPTGRCAEITKQRDLGTKGLRIGFKLETVTLGTTKWKSPAVSCVVVPADAPQKSSCKRLSEVAGAIVEFLSTKQVAIKKGELVKHFKDRYSSSSVYRQLSILVHNGQASDSMGYVKLLVQTGAN